MSTPYFLSPFLTFSRPLLSLFLSSLVHSSALHASVVPSGISAKTKSPDWLCWAYFVHSPIRRKSFSHAFLLLAAVSFSLPVCLSFTVVRVSLSAMRASVVSSGKTAVTKSPGWLFWAPFQGAAHRPSSVDTLLRETRFHALLDGCRHREGEVFTIDFFFISLALSSHYCFCRLPHWPTSSTTTS